MNAQATTSSGALADLLQRIEAAPLSLLLLDYDGTLAPFHVDRNRAYPYPGVVSLLQKIVQSGRTRIVIVSGRPVAELRALLAPLERLEMWGSHGMERLLSDGSYTRTQVSRENIAVLTEAEQWISASGLLSNAETKLGGIAIHWRGLAPAEASRVETLTRHGWTPLAQRSGLKLLEFEAGLELRVPHPDKGNAVRSILAGLDSNVPIAYLGDDLTDEEAFRALSQRGLSILVRSEFRETIASAWIKPPQGLVAFLEQWLSSISGL